MSDSRFDWTISITLSLALMAAANAMAPSTEGMRKLYTYLRRDARWMPPGWLFGLAWSVLYPLIAVSIVLWSDRDVLHRTGAMWYWTWILFIVNLVANLAWSSIFFGAFRPNAKPDTFLNAQKKPWIVSRALLNLAVVDAVVIAATAGALETLFAVDTDERKTSVIVMWAFYLAWTLYAFLLTLEIALRE